MKRAKRFTIDDIREWGPCYDPTMHIPEYWEGTVFDILELKDVPESDLFWVVLRTELCSEKLMRLFAVWCARQMQHLMTDPRSLAALDVAEKFALGLATKEELAAARVAALDAVGVAALAAAGAAAWAAARAAAWAAARDAARAAARAAAGAAAWNAARDAQRNKLVEMLCAGVDSGDTVLEIEE